MWNGTSAFDTDIDYAVRMVRAGCASVEQAARTCGVPLATLRAHLTGNALSGTATRANTLRTFDASRV